MQNGGINRADSFFLAYNPNSRGTFTMNEGQLTANNETVSNSASAHGLFIQNNGVNESQSSLVLGGSSTASDGTYELHDGMLLSGNLVVGDKGAGTFIQSGGAAGINNTLTIAAQSGSSGNFDQQAGSISANRIVNNGTFRSMGILGVATSFINTATAIIGGRQDWSDNSTLQINGGKVEMLTNAGTPGSAFDPARRHPLGISVAGADSTLILKSDQDLRLLTFNSLNPGRQSLDLASPSDSGAFRELRIHGGSVDHSIEKALFASIANANRAGAADPFDGIYDSGLAAHPNSAIGISSVIGIGLVIRPTRIGDLNLDGQVTIADFIDMATNFNSTDPFITWQQGDVNYDGAVTIADFIDLAANFNSTYAGTVLPTSENDRALLASFASSIGANPAMIGSAVPEPASLSLLSLLTLPLLRRRQSLGDAPYARARLEIVISADSS
jgi:hypothetical protein